MKSRVILCVATNFEQTPPMVSVLAYVPDPDRRGKVVLQRSDGQWCADTTNTDLQAQQRAAICARFPHAAAEGLGPDGSVSWRSACNLPLHDEPYEAAQRALREAWDRMKARRQEADARTTGTFEVELP